MATSSTAQRTVSLAHLELASPINQMNFPVCTSPYSTNTSSCHDHSQQQMSTRPLSILREGLYDVQMMRSDNRWSHTLLKTETTNTQLQTLCFGNAGIRDTTSPNQHVGREQTGRAPHKGHTRNDTPSTSVNPPTSLQKVSKGCPASSVSNLGATKKHQHNKDRVSDTRGTKRSPLCLTHRRHKQATRTQTFLHCKEEKRTKKTARDKSAQLV